MGFGDVYFSLRHTQIGRPEKHVSKNVKGPKFMASRRKRTINLLGCGGATFYSRWICKDTPQAMGVLVSANKAHFVWVCGFCRVRMISYSQRIQQKKSPAWNQLSSLSNGRDSLAGGFLWISHSLNCSWWNTTSQPAAEGRIAKWITCVSGKWGWMKKDAVP